MKLLESKADVEFLVNAFYKKVEKSEIGFFFTEIAHVDWGHHLPKMYAFWETLLFGEVSYKGNPMAAHFPINAKMPMEKHHFETWLQIWTKTVEENFYGETAEMAIYKAGNIARLMGLKMETATKLSDSE